MGVGVVDLGIGLGRGHSVEACSTRPDDEFSNAIGGIGGAARRLGREPLVDVFVAVEHDLRVVVVERLPQWLDVLRLAAVNIARIEERLVPVGEAALVGVGREIGPEPYLLGRTHSRRDFTIERNDVPVPEIKAVVALARGARQGSEIREVARCVGGVIVVVARARPRSCLVPAPGRVVVGGVIGRRTVRIGVIDDTSPSCQLEILPAEKNNFRIPVRLTASCSSVPAEQLKNYVIFWFNPATKTWVPVVGSTVDLTRKTVSAPLQHFSVYAVGAKGGKAGW